MNNHCIVGLFQCVEWQLPESLCQLDSNACLCKYKDSDVGDLVKKLAEDIDFDEGEPFGYETYVKVTFPESMHPKDLYNYLSSRGVEMVCSLLGIVQGGGYPDLCHVIYMHPQSRPWIDTIHDINNPQIDTIQNMMYERGIKLSINETTVKALKIALSNFNKARTSENKFNHVDNALKFYSNAWRSPTEVEALIHLNVALESLFAPHSHSEISHQIGINLSRFLTSDPAERKPMCENVKKIYTERSKIIHGEPPSGLFKLTDVLWEAYVITAKALSKILMDENVTAIFANNDRRRQFLTELQLS